MDRQSTFQQYMNGQLAGEYEALGPPRTGGLVDMAADYWPYLAAAAVVWWVVR